MTVAASSAPTPRKTLAVCGGAHALHDGFTDLLNVLYPLLQAQFGLSYAAIGTLKAIYSSAMAAGQIPSGWLARRLGGVAILIVVLILSYFVERYYDRPIRRYLMAKVKQRSTRKRLRRAPA